MAKVRGERSKSKLGLVSGLILLLLIFCLGACLYFYYPQDCKTDSSCFVNAAQSCSKAKVITYKEGNEFIYEIKERQKEDCIFSVKLNKMKEGVDYKLVQLLEGKDMLCQVPMEDFKKNPMADTKDIIGKCSGSLKEAIQQLTIERLYSVVVGNIGGVNKELQKLIS